MIVPAAGRRRGQGARGRAWNVLPTAVRRPPWPRIHKPPTRTRHGGGVGSDAADGVRPGVGHDARGKRRYRLLPNRPHRRFAPPGRLAPRPPVRPPLAPVPPGWQGRELAVRTAWPSAVRRRTADQGAADAARADDADAHRIGMQAQGRRADGRLGRPHERRLGCFLVLAARPVNVGNAHGGRAGARPGGRGAPACSGQGGPGSAPARPMPGPLGQASLMGASCPPDHAFGAAHPGLWPIWPSRPWCSGAYQEGEWACGRLWRLSPASSSRRAQ